jgi:hypothetical protein
MTPFNNHREKIKITEWLVVAAIALPMLYINVRHSQHWGDDFAVYVQQAINIANGKPFDATGYLFIPGYSSLAPSAPVGFSLMLVPIVKLVGFNIGVCTGFMACLFVIWMFVSYVFFRNYFSFSTAAVMLIAAFYPNFLFWMKLLIASDIPFTILLLIICLYFSFNPAGSLKRFAALGILAGAATIIRPAGVVLIPALWLLMLKQEFSNHNTGKNSRELTWAKVLLFSCTAIVFF